MPGKAVGRTAAALPWLCPNTDSLIRLAESPASLARPADPALLAFLLRFTATAHPGLFSPAALATAALPDAAAAFLTATPLGWIPPQCELAKRCRTLTAAASALARRIADRSRRASPDRADAVATLAPLGWLAVATLDPGAAAEPLHDPDAPPAATLQEDVWGLDQDAIARRLALRWRLPDWIGTALGNLSLPLSAARAVVADPDLFAVAQLAILEAEQRLPSLGLTHGADRAALLKQLKFDDAAIVELCADLAAEDAVPAASALDQDPHKVPLVANLLRMAGESRRRNGVVLVARLEDRLDDLHRAVAHVGGDADAQARDARLAALAELAAGAGHEINNPLAVISGNAQRLLRTEPDPERSESLHAINRQSQRIAGIVRDLMQFARPPRPRPQRVCAAELVAAVRDELSPFAAEKGVRVEVAGVPPAAFVRGDPAQLRQALAAVARNGIEAAGRDGWVRVICAECDEHVTFAVEDSGPGLTPDAAEHAFDPFYCGRSAGRGRGLGLPTAWQFLRQNGGDLRHEPAADGPTRFVVTVPRSISLDFLDRQSA